MDIGRSLALFVFAGLCEVGGGYLVWLWLRDAKPLWVGLLGGSIVVLYAVVATLQPANFGRVYAAYGGIFIVIALLWGWRVDAVVPDRIDIVGASIALLGMLVMMYWPRG